MAACQESSSINLPSSNAIPQRSRVIEEVYGDQIMSKQYFVTVNGSRATKGFVQMVEEPKSNELFADVGKAAEQKAMEDLVHVRINEKNPDKFFLLGSSMSSTERIEVMEFLTSNIEVFAWTPYDMPGIDPSFICHQLNVHPTARPIIQCPVAAPLPWKGAISSRFRSFKQLPMAI